MAEVSLAPFARNATGRPDTRHFALGRVIIMIAELTAADVPDADGFVHLGNAPNFGVTLKREYLDHFSSMAGVRDRDERILINDVLDVDFGLEEPTEKAAAIFFSATPASYTNVAIAGFTEYAMITAVKKGNTYPIKSSAGGYAFGIAASDLNVEKSGSPDTALVKDTDYTLDEKTGEITFLTSGVVLADGDQVDVTLGANGLAETTRKIPILSRDDVTVAMRIKGTNGRDGEAFLLEIPKISLTPNGALPLVTAQELMVIPLTGGALKVDSTTPLGTLYALPPGGVT
jgi:hypothetical protein